MRPVLSWQVNAAEGKEGTASSPVYDCCFNPAGTQLVVACGNLVLVYDPTDGLLMHRLRGHKDTVYCVTYAKDGKSFASGGADKNVIIWKSTAEGILKYGHNDSIQALSYNPVTLQLASVTASDFGVWSPDQKSVSKHKISAKGLCCSWSNDGQLLAIGQFDGTVTVRDKSGLAKYTYLRGGPVWSVSFNPSTPENTDILAVTAWDQTLVFYSLDDYSSDKKPAEQRVMGREKQLGMDPCCVRYFVNGEYMAMSGSDNKAHLWTKDGVRLLPICERESWIWCVAPRPKQNYVAVGTNDGMLAVYQLVFATVHGLYQERYVSIMGLFCSYNRSLLLL
jgi:intraflagellar transport protein 122